MRQRLRKSRLASIILVSKSFFVFFIMNLCFLYDVVNQKELFVDCNLPRLIKSTHGENIIPLKINHHYIKRTDIFRYLWHGDNQFTENEIKQINDRYKIIEELNDLIKDFRKLFADKSIIELCLL